MVVGIQCMHAAGVNLYAESLQTRSVGLQRVMISQSTHESYFLQHV